MDDLDEKFLSRSDAVVQRARKELETIKIVEAENDKAFDADLQFANGDPDNGWQWPNNLYLARTADPTNARPCLTINMVQQHNRHIKNNARQNKTGIKVRPTGGDATFKAAEAIEGLIRHIEYRSSADTVYDWAIGTQVDGGIGYWMVDTAYESDDSFDQEACICRIKDPRTVKMDTNCVEFDKSDARFGFIFEKTPRDVFNQRYPKFKDMVGKRTGLGDDDFEFWLEKDNIRIAKYYRRNRIKDMLVAYIDQETQQQTIKKRSELARTTPPEILADLLDKRNKDKYQVRTRPIESHEVERFIIAGDMIIEEGENWPGTIIPIVPVVGVEYMVDGKIYRKGHTRDMKDAQRIFNYNASASVEDGALQTKIPYLVTPQMIAGYENDWKAANTTNKAYLLYNDIDDAGDPLPNKPERVPRPMKSDLWEAGMQSAQQWMMMASGQFQAQKGEEENAKSGVAINARQRQGENATYHFDDNQAVAIRKTGRILLEIIPKLYDTARIKKILAKDGSQTDVRIDPSMAQAHMEHDPSAVPDGDEAPILVINPSVGKYDVQADTGPSYATQRQEAFNALIQIMTQAPDLTKVIGDLLLRNADFPSADEAAERIKRTIPANILGTAPPPEVVQLQGQVEQMQALVTKLSEKLASERGKTRSKEELRDVNVYRAETDRLAVLLKSLGVTPEMIQQISGQLGTDAAQVSLTPIVKDNAADVANQGGSDNPEDIQSLRPSDLPIGMQNPVAAAGLPKPETQGAQ